MDETKIRNIGFTTLFAALALISILDIILIIANKTYSGLGIYFLIDIGICILAGVFCGLLNNKQNLQNVMIVIMIIGVVLLLILIGIMVIRLAILNPWTIISWAACIGGLAILDSIWG